MANNYELNLTTIEIVHLIIEFIVGKFIFKIDSINPFKKCNSNYIIIGIILAIVIFISRIISGTIFYDEPIFSFHRVAHDCGEIISRVIVWAFIEEIIYRFISFKILNELNLKLRIIITSAMFLIPHIYMSFFIELYNNGFSKATYFNIIGFIAVFFAGILFAYSYELSKNLLVPFFLHIGMNSVLIFYTTEDIIWAEALWRKGLFEICYLLIAIFILFLFNKIHRKKKMSQTSIS